MAPASRLTWSSGTGPLPVSFGAHKVSASTATPSQPWAAEPVDFQETPPSVVRRMVQGPVSDVSTNANPTLASTKLSFPGQKVVVPGVSPPMLTGSTVDCQVCPPSDVRKTVK